MSQATGNPCSGLICRWIQLASMGHSDCPDQPVWVYQTWTICGLVVFASLAALPD